MDINNASACVDIDVNNENNLKVKMKIKIQRTEYLNGNISPDSFFGLIKMLFKKSMGNKNSHIKISSC